MIEDSEDGLIVAYLLDGTGGGKRLDWEDIYRWKPEDGVLWVHLNYTQARAQQWLAENSGQDDIVYGNLLAEDTRPRSTVHKKGLLLTLRGVNTNPGADPADMVTVRIYITNNLIISTRNRRLLSINDIVQALDSGDGPKASGEFLVFLTDRLSMRLDNVINELEETVDLLEEEVLQHQHTDIRHRLNRVRHESITLKRYLAPQRDAMSRLYTEKVAWLEDEDRMYLREISDRVLRYVEDLDSARERAALIQEELTNLVNEEMNQRMYILSIIAATFLPLGFLTGLLGVNVGGIPGNQNSSAFWEVTAGLVLISILQILFFRHKKWM